MQQPGLVIFDCDGVLVDTETLANRRLSAWLSEAGYAIGYEECRRTFCGRSMKSVQDEVEASGVLLGDFVDRWYRELPGLFEEGLEPVPHVETAVLALKDAGIPWCVASSANVEKMHLTLGRTGLLRHFEDVLFSASMVERGKPFPDLFLHAARTMGFAPEACVVVEDAVPGVEAARAAGMRVVGYHGDPLTNRDGLAAAGAVLLDDMRRLPGLLGLR
ncbi:MAG: HAD family phosphatase [Mesorhizobium sp.]|nr:HAD family phosphatase [Mesorhizobium sp.]